jgi:hypothetical protein
MSEVFEKDIDQMDERELLSLEDDNNEYEYDEMIEPLRKFTGSISNGNELEFEGRNFTYFVFSELSFAIKKIVKMEMKKLNNY